MQTSRIAPVIANTTAPDDLPDHLPDDVGAMGARAGEAAALLKALSHEGRLMILCHISEGERSVTELEDLIGARQSAVSQQLARLRLEGLVTARRDGKTIFYSIADDRVRRVVRLMYDLFCGTDIAAPADR